MKIDNRIMRRKFLHGLLGGLRLVWPVLSILLIMIVAAGLVVGRLEKWSLQESVYFSFITGLTIGYGDFSPTSLVTRALSVMIGFFGLLMTALVAAVAVRALSSALGNNDD